jgi:hypothetical protein
VGSSPTAPTKRKPCKWTQNQSKRNRLGENAEPIYTNYYTNALRKGIFHRFGGALLHGR